MMTVGIPRRVAPRKHSRAIHLSLNLRGAIRNRDFGWFTKPDGTDADPDDVFTFMLDKIAAGWEAIPIGECDDFDPKTGCRGHAIEEKE